MAPPSSQAEGEIKGEASKSSTTVKGTPTPSTDFPGFVDQMTSALDETTSAAANFPDKSDLSFHRTLDRKFSRRMDKTSDRVLHLADRLLQLVVESQQQKANETGKAKVKPRRKLADEDDVVDSFQAAVVEPVDSLLENADANLDEVNGQKFKKAAIDINPALEAQAGKKLPGPAKKYLASDLIHAQGISKPQLLFRDPIDNFQESWEPSLPVKHHSMVPLGYEIGPDDEIEWSIDPDSSSAAARRERLENAKHHPYYYETRHLPYPTSMFSQTTPRPPRSFKDTPFEFVNTPEQLDALTDKLLAATEIAVDLEYHQMRSYYGFVCLMQISTREQDWVVDTLALRSEIRDHKLGGVFADPSIVKVFHGADSDMPWLQQDFDIYVVNLFDTYHAAKVLEFPQFSLASLLQLYCHFDADKKYQMADWRIRPLPEEMLAYARSDTHFLLFIYDNLRNALISRSSRTPSPAVESESDSRPSTPKPNPQRAMRDVLLRSAETALKLNHQEGYDRENGGGKAGWANLAKKLGKKEVLDTQVGWVFKAIHEWRDRLSRELDESPHFVLPNHVVIQLANLRPKNTVILTKSLTKPAPLVLPRSDELIKVIQDAASAHSEYIIHNSGKAKSPEPKAAGGAHTNKRVQKVVATPKTVDVWADLITGKPDRARSSALFGQVLPTQAAPSTNSSLFGSTLSAVTNTPAASHRSRLQSPGFAAAHRNVIAALETTPLPTNQAEAPQPVQQPVQQPDEEMPAAPQPESVAFVPAGKRSNISPATGPVSTSSKADTVKQTSVVDDQGIVSVKKKAKRARANNKATAAAVASAPAVQSVAGSSSSGGGSASAKKPKKTKVQAKDIPEFDYAAEPNLLDQPQSKANKSKNAKPRADKKKKNQGYDTGFQKAPSDPSQPKSGIRSATFTS